MNILLVCLFVSLSLAQKPPVITKAFQATYSLSLGFPHDGQMSYYSWLAGIAAVDYETNQLFINFGSDPKGATPLLYDFSLIVTDTMSSTFVSDARCWLGAGENITAYVPDLAIPAGKEVVDGKLCEIWVANSSLCDRELTTFAIRMDDNIPAYIECTSERGSARVTFTDIGSVYPDYFEIPFADCTYPFQNNSGAQVDKMLENIPLNDPAAVADPPIPQIADVFSAEYVILLDVVSGASTQLFTGNIAFDRTHNNSYISLSAAESLPMIIELNSLCQGTTNDSDCYMFLTEGRCANGGLTALTFDIPSTAQYSGNTTINGSLCNFWEWTYTLVDYPIPVLMAIRVSDNVPMLYITSLGIVGFEVHFTPTSVGKVNPMYFREPIGCLDIGEPLPPTVLDMAKEKMTNFVFLTRWLDILGINHQAMLKLYRMLHL